MRAHDGEALSIRHILLDLGHFVPFGENAEVGRGNGNSACKAPSALR